MLLGAILSVLVGILNLTFWLLSFGGHKVYIASIPFAGNAMYTALVTAMGYWNTILDVVPYLSTPWNIFLYVIIPFEIGVIILKVVLGSRIPVT